MWSVVFEFAHEVGHGGFCRNSDKQVSVIVVATNSDGETFEIARNAGHVCPDLLSELIVLQQRAAFFRAENNVIEKLLMGSHVSPSAVIRWLTPPAGDVLPSGQ